MNYFGGFGVGKGWKKHNFILTPIEFELLFTDLQFYFVITNSSVPIDYKYSNNDSIFKAYALFFEQVLIGQQEITREEKLGIEQNIRISVIDEFKKIDFESIVNKKGVVISQEYKLVKPREPVINISPFYLTVTEDEKLNVTFMNEEGIIGLELTYPKFVSWERDDFNSIQETSNYTSSGLFDILVERIKNIAHKAKVISDSKIYKPNFWISNAAAVLINKNRFLTLNNLRIH